MMQLCGTLLVLAGKRVGEVTHAAIAKLLGQMKPSANRRDSERQLNDCGIQESTPSRLFPLRFSLNHDGILGRRVKQSHATLPAQRCWNW